MPKAIHAGITGVGSAVPDKIMTNEDWAKIVDTSDEWIKTRTGISERRISDKHTSTSTLAVSAAKKALADAGVSAKEIELIIVATTTPDYPLFPSTAALLQEELGCSSAYGFDLSAACSGFGYALTTASQYIENGFAKNVLLVAADTLSKNVDRTDRNVCVLFGDAAGALVLQPVEKNYGLLSSVLGLRGSGANDLIVHKGGSRHPLTKESAETRESYIHMNGKEVFKFAVNIMGEATAEAIQKAKLENSDIDHFIPHQANIRIIEAAMKRLGLSSEKVYVNIQRYGNTSSASIPLALDEVYRAGRLKRGDLLATCGFGAGLTWAANVFRWSK